MRVSFIERLVALAGEDERIVLLTGDLGFQVLEPFADRFPDRFVNVGVAEQNLIGLAGGMAASGLLPFVYSIATFATLRPFEMLRAGPAHHDWPVRVVGVGGGFAYGPAGRSHHALEDLALMRSLPAFRVVVPAEPAQAAAALDATWDHAGPVYYRLDKREDECVPGLEGRFGSGLEVLSEGADALLLAAGPVAGEAVDAATRLEAHGIAAGVAVLSQLAPAPCDALAAALARVPLALSVEEHVPVGGLGAVVAEVLADRAGGTRLVRAHVDGAPDGRTGSRDWLRRRHGLDAASLAKRLLREVAHAVD